MAAGTDFYLALLARRNTLSEGLESSGSSSKNRDLKGLLTFFGGCVAKEVIVK